MLQGAGMNQSWLTTLEPEKVLKRQGPTVFGNPHRTRKAVHSSEVALRIIRHVPKTSLKYAFPKEVRELAPEGGIGRNRFACHDCT